MNRSLITLLGVALVTSLATAHEFWMEPSKFRVGAGEAIGVRLMVGDGFPGEVRPRDPTKLREFVMLGAKGREELKGIDGETPAGWVRAAEPGNHVIGYRSSATPIDMTAEKFEAYLREEGLDHVVAEREKAGETNKPVLEHFSRAAKSIVNVGGTHDEGHLAQLGYPVEITPSVDPYLARSGDALKFKVTMDGAPRAGMKVHAFFQGDVKHRLEGLTDADGVLELTLDRPGVWMLATIRMNRAPEGSGADWESIWASLTFELQPAETAPSKTK